MKKMISIIVALLLLFSLSACKKEEAVKEDSTKEVKTEKKAEVSEEKDASKEELKEEAPSEKKTEEKKENPSETKEEAKKEEPKTESVKTEKEEVKKEEPKKEEKPQEIETEVIEITEDSQNLFSNIPKKFTYVADNNDETVINFGKDGAFTGTFKSASSEYRFKGQFSQSFPLDAYTNVSILQEYSVTEVKKGDSTTGGLSNMKEVVFYVPGAPTSAISEEFLNCLPGHENFGEKLPDNVYGIFDMTNRTGFYGEK